MMTAQYTHKGRTEKTVVVGDITTEDDRAIIGFALAAAGESRSSVFGVYMDPPEDGATTVVIYTD